ncbi:unnamed protein product [Penicillium glandicola]
MAALLRNDSRIILHLDYDCFYASVFEAEQPELRSLPLAVQQKQIVVTCNYEARRRGLHKLQLIKDAKRICPEVVIVLGEDLTKFRNASKELYLLVRSLIWGGRVEKLGFDELFLDVTEMIDYNTAVLNQNDLPNSYFHLDRKDPTVGFSYDGTRFQGSTFPIEAASVTRRDSSSLEMRLLVASHLQGHIRSKLENQIGFTATGGISTSKLLAKLVGNVHKPNGQTTLLPPYTAENNTSNVFQFLDDHEIRKIPGIGSRITQKLKSHITGQESTDEKVTVKDVRQFPGMGPPLLDRILGGPGSVKGIGIRMWSILHGVDNSDVLEGRDLPTQISIEDSYGRLGLDTLEKVRRELVVLSRSLIRRVRTDLLDMSDDTAPQGRWRAHPRTLRLSTRPRLPPDSGAGRTHGSNRISRSVPLPPFIFNLDENIDALAERLVRESVFSMFRKLHPEKAGWNLGLLNIAVTNMVESAGDQKQNSGRDIGKMFRQQETVLKDWTVQEPESLLPDVSRLPGSPEIQSDDGWDDDEPLGSVDCPICGGSIPYFAQLAHQIYHSEQ